MFCLYVTSQSTVEWSVGRRHRASSEVAGTHDLPSGAGSAQAGTSALRTDCLSSVSRRTSFVECRAMASGCPRQTAASVKTHGGVGASSERTFREGAMW